ncbi:hypothetical protein DVH05_017132 [Phytophthora capsici]|nr:hypothetical protein DVH05_017132 [Phytophthora capsici]
MNRQRPSRRRRLRRRQAAPSQVGPADSHEVSQVSTRGDPANPALQLLVDQPGPENDQNSSTAVTKTFRRSQRNMPRRSPVLETQAADQHWYAKFHATLKQKNLSDQRWPDNGLTAIVAK